MDHRPIRKDFLKYTSQNMMGMIGLSCYILADTYFVSQGLGPDGLTALNLAIPFYNFIQGVGLMLGMGGATKFSILRGEGREEEALGVFTQSLLMALVGALVFVIPGVCFPNQLSTLLGGTGVVHGMTATYLRVLLSFSPAFLLNNVLLCYVRNDCAPRLAMTAMLGGSFSNILLDYLFIFPLDMGMFGVVLATGLAPVISLIILAPHFRNSSLRFKKEGLRLRGVGEMAALGSPSLISELSSGLVLILFNLIILDLAGNLGVAGYGVVANIYLVVLALFTGLGQGIQPLVSAAWGRRDRERVHAVYKYALWAVVGLAASVYLLSVLLDGPIVAAFNREKDPLLQEIAVRGLRLYFTAFLFAGFNIVTAVFFSSMDRPRSGFTVSILRGFILIVPLAVLMSRLWGMDGVWLSAPVSEAITALVAVILLRKAKTA